MPRKEDRYPYLKEVELEFASGRRTARISDISMGGCYVDTIAQVPTGEALNLHMTSMTGDRFEFTGKVAYQLDGFGFGVEFTNLTDDQKNFLEQVINQNTAG